MAKLGSGRCTDFSTLFPCDPPSIRVRTDSSALTGVSCHASVDLCLQLLCLLIVRDNGVDGLRIRYNVRHNVNTKHVKSVSSVCGVSHHRHADQKPRDIFRIAFECSKLIERNGICVRFKGRK